MVFVSDMGEKQALLTSGSDAYFTTPHYEGSPIVLVNVDKIDLAELRELITDSWRIKAPTAAPVRSAIARGEPEHPLSCAAAFVLAIRAQKKQYTPKQAIPTAMIANSTAPKGCSRIVERAASMPPAFFGSYVAAATRTGPR